MENDTPITKQELEIQRDALREELTNAINNEGEYLQTYLESRLNRSPNPAGRRAPIPNPPPTAPGKE
jgi:hypothetical protein